MKSEIVDWDERLIDTLCREGKVVILTAATAAVGTFLNEQDGIEIKLHGFLFQIEIFQIDDAYLRMPCLAT